MSIRFYKFFPKWGIVVTLGYVLAYIIQRHIIFPLETQIFPALSEIASVIYLPHAARILGIAIVGPRAFFALFPTAIALNFIDPANGSPLLTHLLVLVSAVGAGCGVLAYYSVKRFYAQADSFETALYNWKPVVMIGVMASVFNSIGLSLVYYGYFDLWNFPVLQFKYFVGDMLGLMVGLLLLVFMFRLIRGANS